MLTREDVKEYVETSGLVNVKPTHDGLFVLKYKKKVFFDNLWNEYIAECRGTIVDKDFNLVSYPFTKIYNYGIEKEAPVLPNDTMVDAYRKVNGFMVAITWHSDINDILVSTTGSTDSDYVEMAYELIDLDVYREVCKTWHNMTFMFECVHPNDPHVIPEKTGMYLLGYRQKEWGSRVFLDHKVLRMLSIQFNTEPVEHMRISIGNLVQHVKNVRHEGFVFYTDDGVSAKIKSPYYLTSKWVARNPRTDKLIDLKRDIKKNLDEEYYPLIDAIRVNIEAYTKMDEQSRLEWVRNFMSK